MFYDWLSLFIAIHTERLDEPRKDVITFGSAIHACGADWKRAISFLQQMQDEKVPINLLSLTCLTMFSGTAKLGLL